MTSLSAISFFFLFDLSKNRLKNSLADKAPSLDRGFTQLESNHRFLSGSNSFLI